MKLFHVVFQDVSTAPDLPFSTPVELFHVVFQDVSTARCVGGWMPRQAVPRRISRRFHSPQEKEKEDLSGCSTSYFKTFPQQKFLGIIYNEALFHVVFQDVSTAWSGDDAGKGLRCSTSYFKTFPQRERWHRASVFLAVPRRISRRFHSPRKYESHQSSAVPRRISRRFHSTGCWRSPQMRCCSTSYFKTFPQHWKQRSTKPSGCSTSYFKTFPQHPSG